MTAVDTGYYVFSSKIWKMWTDGIMSYDVHPCYFCVRQELSGIPPVYDRLVLMVCPEFLRMFI